jgi:hypothetical protein
MVINSVATPPKDRHSCCRLYKISLVSIVTILLSLTLHCPSRPDGEIEEEREGARSRGSFMREDSQRLRKR